MAYNHSARYDEMKVKQHVPFYFNHLGIWQTFFASPSMILMNIFSIIFIIASIIAPLAVFDATGQAWVLFFLFLISLGLIFPILTAFIATRPELDSQDNYDLRVDAYLRLPKSIKKKLKPLAKHANYNRDDAQKWAEIVQEYSKLEESGQIESKFKSVYDSVLEDIKARKQTQRIMKENGWI